MNKNVFIRICLITGLGTTGFELIYGIADHLLVYRYIDYQYYVAGVALVALITGIVLTNRYFKNQPLMSQKPNSVEKLTAKEFRILEQIAGGGSNKEIAALNYIELSTVKTHINNIYAKLGVKNRKEATIMFRKLVETSKSTFSPPAVI